MATNRNLSTAVPASSVHINPKFRSAHINPNFLNKKPLEPIASNQIHVNPKFYNNYLQAPTISSHPTPIASIQPSTSQNTVTVTNNRFSIKRLPIKATIPSPIISKTNKKIVRQPLQAPTTYPSISKLSISSSRIAKSYKNPLVQNHPKSLVRQGALLNKYAALRSKYSIDYRKTRTPQRLTFASSLNQSLGATTVIVNNYKLRRMYGFLQDVFSLLESS